MGASKIQTRHCEKLACAGQPKYGACQCRQGPIVLVQVHPRRSTARCPHARLSRQHEQLRRGTTKTSCAQYHHCPCQADAKQSKIHIIRHCNSFVCTSTHVHLYNLLETDMQSTLLAASPAWYRRIEVGFEVLEWTTEFVILGGGAMDFNV